jgi:hypothetical protein
MSRTLDVVTKTMKTIESLNKWWLSDTKHRAKHGIVLGTAEYAELVAACTGKKAELQKVDALSAGPLHLSATSSE